MEMSEEMLLWCVGCTINYLVNNKMFRTITSNYYYFASLINCVVYELKNGHHNFPEPKEMSSDDLFDLWSKAQILSLQ